MALQVASEAMQPAALTSDRDYYTREANENCINSGPRTRTKFYYDSLYRLDHSTLGSTTNLQMHYDAMGNITSRSDVAAGAAWTYDPTHKHQVTQAGSSSFTDAYDANGNVKTRNGTALAWTSYNYPSDVATATEGAAFDYGPNRQRWRMTYSSSAGTETTYYATPAFQIVATSSGTDFRHYLYAEGRPVVVISRTTTGAVNVRSLLTDHQNSISESVTDQSAAPSIYSRESFTVYGNRREASTWSGSPTTAELTTMNGVTREGYTFQTVLGSMGLNHMNGRVQDAITGRFLSADRNVQDLGNTQSFNRYSYVNNNPLTFTDPTGFEEDVPADGGGGGGGGGGDGGGGGGGAPAPEPVPTVPEIPVICTHNCGPDTPTPPPPTITPVPLPLPYYPSFGQPEPRSNPKPPSKPNVPGKPNQPAQNPKQQPAQTPCYASRSFNPNTSSNTKTGAIVGWTVGAAAVLIANIFGAPEVEFAEGTILLGGGGTVATVATAGSRFGSLLGGLSAVGDSALVAANVGGVGAAGGALTAGFFTPSTCVGGGH